DRVWHSLERLTNPLGVANWLIRENMRANANHISGRVLDVGCGLKPYAELFATDAYVGIELRPTREGIVDVLASALHLPFLDGAFDAVVSNQVLEHVPEPSQMLSEAFRVLRPGGYLLLTTPQTWGLHHVPHDYYRYTPFGLRYLAEKNGFQVAKVYP